MKKTLLKLIAIFAICTTTITIAQGQVIYYVKSPVDPLAPVKPITITNDARSWDMATDDLQAAIDAAYKYRLDNTGADVQVWVTEGTYTPLRITNNDGIPPTSPSGGISNKDHAFVLRPNVKIYGGFPNTVTSVNDGNFTIRNWQTYTTTLSGDLGSSNSVYHVVISAGPVGSATIDGFGITGAVNTLSSADYIVFNDVELRRRSGGGVFVYSSSPMLNNLDIYGNGIGGYGGGIDIERAGAQTRLSNSTVRNNTSGMPGGGIHLSGNAEGIVISNVIVANNTSSANGGGIYAGSATKFIDVTISGNKGSNGGGLYNNNNSTLTNMLISGNTANNGGGLYNNNNSTLTNTLISGNTATNGGGIYNNGNHSHMLTNVTVAGNFASSTTSGGIYNSSNTFATLQNTLVWGNSSGINDITNSTFSHSLVQNLTAVGILTGYLSTSSIFVDLDQAIAIASPTTGGDYSLLAGTGLINAGDSTLLKAALVISSNLSATFDIKGNSRLIGKNVDVGAVESYSLFTVNFNTDGGTPVASQLVDVNDLVTPVSTIKPSYILEGWFTHPTTGVEWDFSSMLITHNITLYARWKTCPGLVIGNYIWEEVNANAAGGFPYYHEMYPNANANELEYGLLYDFAAAQSVCPAGWELPNSVAAAELISLYSSADLKATGKWMFGNAYDNIGFTALPAGMYNAYSERYELLKGDAFFWTADGKVIHLDCHCGDIQLKTMHSANRVSVRCVRKCE